MTNAVAFAIVMVGVVVLVQLTSFIIYQLTLQLIFGKFGQRALHAVMAEAERANTN